LATDEQIKKIKMIPPYDKQGKTYPWGKIYKSDKLKQVADQDPDAPEGAQSKFWNLGNVIEGILGAAVTAKFLNPAKEISTSDIVQVLKNLTVVGQGKQSQMSMTGRSGNDMIKFTMSLNNNDLRALNMSWQDTELFGNYTKSQEIYRSYQDSAAFANNGSSIKTAIARVAKDTGNNEIIIESEGADATKQRTTKADLFITIDGKRERLLSLKSQNTPQVGQISGHAFENLASFFRSGLSVELPTSINTPANFPVGPFSKVGEQAMNKGFVAAYKNVFGQIRHSLSGDKTKSEYNFVTVLYDAIRYHATLNEDVIVVYLSPSAKQAFSELKIGPELNQALQEFDLIPRHTNDTTIQVYGIPKTALAKEISKNKEMLLVRFRSYVSAKKTIRNIVEVGPLLKLLADVEKIAQRAKMGTEIAKPAAQVTNQATKKPA
jgi:hypothetical protein